MLVTTAKLTVMCRHPNKDREYQDIDINMYELYDEKNNANKNQTPTNLLLLLRMYLNYPSHN